MYEPTSQAARDAKAQGIGGQNYWRYLDRSAQEHFDFYMGQGDEATAKSMLTQTLGEALQGNDGE